MSTATPGVDRATLALRILTPEGVLFEGDVWRVIAPSVDGDVAIMARHAPLEAFLRIGETLVRLADESATRYATTEGFMSVEADGVLILVEQGEEASAIDRPRAEAALKRAEDALASLPDDDEVGRASAAAAKARAENRLRVSAGG
jgi:F-type H+-transporting ATPase subunit epsilon